MQLFVQSDALEIASQRTSAVCYFKTAALQSLPVGGEWRLYYTWSEARARAAAHASLVAILSRDWLQTIRPPTSAAGSLRCNIRRSLTKVSLRTLVKWA